MLSDWMYAAYSGIASGMAIFLVAAGLSWIFGLLKILNMAHGNFLMVGAYVAFSVAGRRFESLGGYIGSALAAAAVVGLLGFVTDKLMFKRLRNVDSHYVLIGTFALLMFVEGLVKLIWGSEFYSVSPPPGLDQPVEIAGMMVPTFTLFAICAGLVVFIGLEYLLHRTWAGKLMQGLANDPWMAGMLGINVPLLLTISVVASFALAGLAGGLLVPMQSLSTDMGNSYLLLAFFAVIIGGLGNVRGAFIASLLLGLVQNLSTVALPNFPGLSIYVALAAFLVWRPNGLFPPVGASTATEAASGSHGPTDPGAAGGGHGWWLLAGAVAWCITASLPWWTNAGLLFLIGLTLVQAVFALSWNLLFGYAGLASFGHAGFFAVGAYFVGACLRYQPGIPFLLVLVAAGVFGAVVAWLVGIVALRRLAGIFLAVLTVALTEILGLIIGYADFLGREDGLSNIPRPRIDMGLFTLDLSSGTAYFLFLLVACTLITGALWWLVNSRYGRLFQTIRLDPERAAFIGTNVAAYRMLAFVISGAVAAVAGGLFAPWARIVTPGEVHWLTSIQPMLNTLLGGVGSFWGPIVGAIGFTVINYNTRTYVGVSEVVVGGILIAIILLAPNGLIGMAKQLRVRLFRAPPSERLPQGALPGTVTMRPVREDAP